MERISAGQDRSLIAPWTMCEFEAHLGAGKQFGRLEPHVSNVNSHDMVYGFPGTPAMKLTS